MKLGKNKWVKHLLDASNTLYIGRFAPSPTGSLHLGSLYTALASFLDARSQNGRWLLRIDDLDTPRNVPGAADSILRTLDIFGLHWDGQVDFQSWHGDEYQEALRRLTEQGYVYRCACSRKTLAALASTPVYPNICRHRLIPTSTPHALRVKTGHHPIAFMDQLQGLVSQNLARQQGDFILKRKENIIGYPFAVVVDDARWRINNIIRGIDLLDETPKQIYLQQLLQLPTPSYKHVPLLVDKNGIKLSKQTLAAPVELASPARIVFKLLQLLNQKPPTSLQQAPLTELLAWATDHWQAHRLQKMTAITLP